MAVRRGLSSNRVDEQQTGVVDPEWKKPAALIGIASVILAAIGVLVAVRQGGDNATPEEHVAHCRETHAAPTTQHKSVFSVGPWADCSWPPAAGADKDGYGEVRLTRADN